MEDGVFLSHLVRDFREFLQTCWRIGWISYGGPAAQIELLHREFVAKRRQISEEHFRQALGLCTLLPGPEAQQLFVLIGHTLFGLRGALCAGGLFVLPGAICMGLASLLYISAPESAWLSAVLFVLRPAALGLILSALLRMGMRQPRTLHSLCVAGGVWLLLSFTSLPYPLFIALAALWGALRPCSTQDIPQGSGIQASSIGKPDVGASFRHLLCGLLVCLLPLGLICSLIGWSHPIVQMGILLAKTAVTAFGGAYAVLPYIASTAVNQHGWISQLQMLDGLALGETTPGPLLLVLQFYGCLTGWNSPAPLSGPLAAVLGSIVAVWTTFATATLWVLIAAPWSQRILLQPRVGSALSSIGLAVCGSLAHLGVQLISSTLWRPEFHWPSALIATAVVGLQLSLRKKR